MSDKITYSFDDMLSQVQVYRRGLLPECANAILNKVVLWVCVLSLCLSVCLPACLSVCLLVCLSVCLFIYSVCSSWLSSWLSSCLCVSLDKYALDPVNLNDVRTLAGQAHGIIDAGARGIIDAETHFELLVSDKTGVCRQVLQSCSKLSLTDMRLSLMAHGALSTDPIWRACWKLPCSWLSSRAGLTRPCPNRTS